MPTDAAAPATAPAQTAAAPAIQAAASTPAPAAAAAAPQQLSLLADAAAQKPVAVATPATATAPAQVAEANKDPAATESAKPNGEQAQSKEAKDGKPKEGENGNEAKDGKAKATESTPADVEIKLPEGVKADDLFNDFKALAKAEGLKSEQAQKVVDLFHKSRAAAEEAAAKAREEQISSMRKAIESDKELGGDHLAETKAIVSRVLNDPRTPPEFNELVKDPILGNHPALVRFLANWGKAIGEDSVEGLVAGGAAAPEKLTPWSKEWRDRVLYTAKPEGR